MSASQRFAFGDFVLERSQQRVRCRDGSILTLSPRLFSALLLFIENAGELLDKDALMRALWPGLVVEDNSLSQLVSGLRRALADDSHDSRYIQTVPRRGFRFIATVTELADSAAPIPLPVAATESRVHAEPPLLSEPARLSEPATRPRTDEAGQVAPNKRRVLRLALATGVAAGLGDRKSVG